ncbi:hypothetical protein GCM10010038_04870 [Glutamicibacter protophormiae]|nr:hypothetical protein GCM10010038_04870 [Glutamicibacter protophormiae]
MCWKKQATGGIAPKRAAGVDLTKWDARVPVWNPWHLARFIEPPSKIFGDTNARVNEFISYLNSENLSFISMITTSGN